MSTESKRNFIVHGSILAMAGILVRVIGLLYRIPIMNIIGSDGNGIYGAAFNVYNIMLVLSSYGLPMAVSKLISARFTEKRYKSAAKILGSSVIVACVTGGIAAIVIFIGADFIENIVYGGALPGLAIPLRVLSPTIFLVAVLGVMRGFFQGQGTMIPTAFSQIVEQVVNAVVSIVAAVLLMRTFAGALKAPAYGAAGSTLGTAAGALTALSFFIFLYAIYHPTFLRMLRRDKSRKSERSLYVYKVIIATMIPIVLGQTFYQISALIDDMMFSNIMIGRDVTDSVTRDLGNFNSSYSLMISIPQGIASAMSASMLPSIVASYTLHNYREVRLKLSQSLKTNMFIAIPSFVGLFVLGEPIIKLLFSGYNSVQGGIMLQLGAIAVVFYTLSTVTSSALQGIDKMRTPMIHSAISLLVHIILVYLLLKFTRLGIYALVIGNASFPILIFILNLSALKNEINYKIPVFKLFAAPAVASLVMGICAWLAYKAMFVLTASNAVSVIIAFLVALITYFLPYYLMRQYF